MSVVRSVLIMALVAAPALAACGEDEEASSAAAPAATPTATAAATEAEDLPADLAGTWKVTIKPSDVRDAPADLRGKTSRWQIEFHTTGGSDDGPSMTLDNADMGTFVLPISVSGEQIAIEEFVECRSLSYAVEGDRLTLEPSDSGCVRDHTLPAILAARPWQRTQ